MLKSGSIYANLDDDDSEEKIEIQAPAPVSAWTKPNKLVGNDGLKGGNDEHKHQQPESSEHQPSGSRESAWITASKKVRNKSNRNASVHLEKVQMMVFAGGQELDSEASPRWSLLERAQDLGFFVPLRQNLSTL